MSLTISTSGACSVGLTGEFEFTDPTGVQSPLSKVIPALLATLNAVSFGQAIVGTSPFAAVLPATPSQLFYMKNLSTTGVVTVTWTPQGGASATILNVEPGGIIFFFDPGAGISALTVISTVNNTTVDYVLAG
jgi:hypothetical protein